MKNIFLFCIALALVFVSLPAYKSYSLKGLWEYQGGVYNGKKEGAPTDYKMQRKYDNQHFEALMLEPDTTPQKFQAGDYRLTADSCFETETFSAIPSKFTNIVIHYGYTLNHDTLTLKGTLPSGMQVKEYWKKVKH